MSQSRYLAIPRIVCLSPGKINLLTAMRDTEGIFTPPRGHPAHPYTTQC